MSYTDPKIYASDPTSFQKGFDASFDRFNAIYAEQKEQQEKLRKERDAAMAAGYNAASLGHIEGIDAKFSNALQKSLNEIIDSGSFADADQRGKAEILQKVEAMKGTFEKIGSIAAIDVDDWDNRNDPRITGFKNALIAGDESISIEGSGLDMKIKGEFGELALSDISSSRLMTREPYEAKYDELSEKFEKEAKAIKESAMESGLPMSVVKEDLKRVFFNRLKSEGPELLSYLYSNSADDEVRDFNKSMLYGDPKRIKNMNPKEAKEFLDKQFNSLAENMYSKIAENIVDPELYMVVKDNKSGSAGYKETSYDKKQRAEKASLKQRVGRIQNASLTNDDKTYGPGMPEIDFTSAKFKNQLAFLGFYLKDIYKDNRGHISITVKDNDTGDLVDISSQGLTEETLKKQLLSLSGADDDVIGGVESTDSGLPIFK